jgi:Spy/CpxP family protein refolding chaperone
MDIKDKYKIIVALLITGLLMFSGCHRHADRWHTSERSAERLTNHIAKELVLNKEQRMQLIEAVTNLMMKKEEILEDNSLKDEMFYQLGSEKIDEARLNGVITEHAKEMEILTKSFVSYLTEFHSTLTPEQKSKLSKLIEEHKDRKLKHHRTYSRR